MSKPQRGMTEPGLAGLELGFESIPSDSMDANSMSRRSGLVVLEGADLFGLGADVLVNAVNCVGVMGKGLALTFKQRFPWCFEPYMIQCRVGELNPGRLSVVKNPEVGRRPAEIVNLPTKRHYREPSSLEDVVLGLDALSAYVKASKYKTFAVPALGCGLGGLQWQVVLPEIRARLGVELGDKCIYVIAPR